MPNRARAFADDPRTTVVLLVLAVLLTGSSILSITIVDDGASAGGLDGSAASRAMDEASPTDHDAGGADGDGTSAGAERSVDDRPGDGASPGSTPSPTTLPTQASADRPAEPEVPGPTVAVTRPGTYREQITTTSSDGSEDSEEVLLIVERIGGGADDVRLRHRRESEGEETGATQEVAWRPDGVYLLATTVGQGGFEIHCEHEPPLLQSPRRLQPGIAWEGDDTCEFDTAGGGTIRFRYEARVREAASITVAGITVSTWLIDTVTDVDVTTAFGSFSQHSEGPVWVDPSRGLTVRSEDDMTLTGDQSAGGGAQRSRVVRELLTLEPR